MPTLLLCVTGMQSADDEERVERALRAEPGVFGAVANRREGCAEIDYEDDECALDRVIEVVRAAGFGATLGG